jgi:TPR repeat protein
MLINKGNSDAMNHLGILYQHREKKYNLMKKYYFMAIRKGNFSFNE